LRLSKRKTKRRKLQPLKLLKKTHSLIFSRKLTWLKMMKKIKKMIRVKTRTKKIRVKLKNLNVNMKFVMQFMNKYYQDLLSFISELLELWTLKTCTIFKEQFLKKMKKIKRMKMLLLVKNQNLKAREEKVAIIDNVKIYWSKVNVKVC